MFNVFFSGVFKESFLSFCQNFLFPFIIAFIYFTNQFHIIRNSKVSNEKPQLCDDENERKTKKKIKLNQKKNNIEIDVRVIAKIAFLFQFQFQFSNWYLNEPEIQIFNERRRF